MRINEFARAGRTTPRAVRHYHQIGLLPEPQRLANGYRDYVLADLARLLRITWLARAGVPLRQIADLETSGGPDTKRELEEVAAAVAAERDRLDRQYDALSAMIEAAERGRALTALPAELAKALDRVAEQTVDASARRVVAADRDMLEVMALTGELGGNLADIYRDLADDPDALRDVLATARAFGELEGHPVDSVRERIDAVVEMFLRTPAVLEALSGGDTPEKLPDDDAAFYLPDPAQREVVRRLLAQIGSS